MSRAFTCLFECNEIGDNADHIRKFIKYCYTEHTLHFFNAAYNQQKAVLDWNATADDVTMSFNMGFV